MITQAINYSRKQNSSSCLVRDGSLVFDVTEECIGPAKYDAEIFEGSWTGLKNGPVKLVSRVFRNGGAPSWNTFEKIDSLCIVWRDPEARP